MTILEVVRSIQFAIGSSVWPARGMESDPYMKVNQEEIPIPGHQQNLQIEKGDSPLWKYCILEYNNKKVNFSMKTLKSYRSCLDRQVNESLRVTRSRAHNLLNSKNEFYQTPIIRIIAASGLHGDQGESQEAMLATGWTPCPSLPITSMQ